MAHKEHKKFSSSVLREICNEALLDLPAAAKDESANWEARAEAALEHLKNKIIDFCGVEHGFGFRNVSRLPRYAQLVYEIIDIVDADIVAEQHGGFVFFWKEPKIADYLKEAVSDKP